jgi:hypothetical protein
MAADSAATLRFRYLCLLGGSNAVLAHRLLLSPAFLAFTVAGPHVGIRAKLVTWLVDGATAT